MLLHAAQLRELLRLEALKPRQGGNAEGSSLRAALVCLPLHLSLSISIPSDLPPPWDTGSFSGVDDSGNPHTHVRAQQKTAGVDVERARAVLEANGPLDLENPQLRTADLKLLETFQASERNRRLQHAGTITLALVGTGLGCLAYVGQSWRFG